MTCAKNFKNWWMCVKATVSQTWELRHILGHSVHSSNEPGELSQRLWQHHLILIIGRIWQTVWPSDRSYLVQSVRSTPSRRVSGDGMLTQTYIMHPIWSYRCSRSMHHSSLKQLMTHIKLLQQQKGDAATCGLCMLSVGFDTQTFSRVALLTHKLHIGYLFT